MERIGDEIDPTDPDATKQSASTQHPIEAAWTEDASPDAEAALVRAVRLLDAGDPAAALDSADAALGLDADRAEAHYARGQALAAMGRHAEAAETFFAAGRLKPGWADAWINYGLAHYALGDVEGAKRAMQGALRAHPGHPAASANLAALLRLTGHGDASERLLDETLNRDPGNSAARLNLVAERLQDGRADDALALLDSSAPDNLDLARPWHLARAAASVGLGRLAEARMAVEALDALGPVPPALLPLRQWRLVLIADAEGRESDARAAADAMATLLDAMGPEAVAEHRIMGHYDLARFWSGRGEHARAFAHWREGHRLLGASQPFSREAAAAFDDAATALFTPARLAAGPRASNTDPAPVFIVGMPRSGTTLCEQIIAAHRDAHGAGERTALWRLFGVLGGNETPESVARVASLELPALDGAAASYLAELHALASNAARIVDKMPGNHRLMWLVALLFPGARVIHCTRDPRDIGLSIFTFRFHGHHGYAHDLANLGWAIAEQDRIMRHWTAALPGVVLTVRLGDWVSDFDGTLARVLDHLGLPPDPNCARFHENAGRVRTVSRAQVREPVNARGLGRWQAYAAELTPLITELERGGALARWDGG